MAGNLLVGVGLAGVVLFGLLTAGLLTTMPSLLGSGDPATSLRDARKLVTDAAATLHEVDLTLGTSTSATEDTAATLSSMAATMRQGSAALQIDVLGQRPFSAVGDLFNQTADRADAAARGVASTSASIASTRASIQAMIVDLNRLSAELDSVSAGPASLLNPYLWLGVLATLVWLFVLAAVALWAGWLLRKGELA